MRIAAIDIGTNSLHIIIVRVHADLSFEIIDREREMVRLGAGGLDGRALQAQAIQAALHVLSKFRRIAEAHRVEEIVAVATSAVREAENGAEFLKSVAKVTGIRARTISGTEEARLIHRAAVHGVGVESAPVVVVDIGGGSVEITRGIGANVELARSFKAGVIRLTERFIRRDPLAAADERRLLKYLRAELGDYLDQIAAAGFDRVIGTSGTVLALGAVAVAEAGQGPPAPLRNRRIATRELHGVRETLSALPLQKRLRVVGLDARRADLIVAGAILLEFILKRIGAREITLCDLSLREGLVLDFVARHDREIAQAERYPDVRRRSVVELADRCSYSPPHAEQIARLALAIFDQTRAAHKLTEREREWLEYAAILHDVGIHISYERHHLHSWYLIRHADLRGFEPVEIDRIALVARYHRRGEPKRRHDGYGELPARARRVVRTLAAILRLAESLDRSHAQVIGEVDLHDRDEDWLLQLRTSGDAELELWSATRQRAPLEDVLGKPLFIEVSRSRPARASSQRGVR